LGNVNNEILTAMTGVGSPFSTGVGSAYSSAFSTHDGYGTGFTNRNNQVVAGVASAKNFGVRGIRQVNTVKYVSPTISGVTVAYGMALENDSGATAAVSTVGVTDMSVRYQAGPLDVMYASLKYKVGSDATLNGGKLSDQTSNLTANSTNTHTALAGSYAVMPTLKVSFSTGGSKASADSIANSKFTQYGAVYTMGQIDIMAQTATVNDKNTANFDRKMTGLGVNYNLSKTARAYVRYDNLNFDTEHAATSGSKIKRTAIGISKSF
jgi:predicted porin